jgi:hypothetical protein
MPLTHLSDQVTVPEDRQEAARAELRRILASQPFRGSRRCCRFLEYSVEHVLQGSIQEELRERNIGIEVFQRAPDYDTAEDAIVRVTANEVRKRLAQYYQETAADSGPVISLPPGSYAVTFRWKPDTPAPVNSVPVPPVRRSLATRLTLVAFVTALLTVSAAVVYAVRGSARSESDPRRTQSGAAGADPLWSRVFRPGQKTNIIMADAARFEIQELLERDLTLTDYLSPDYPGNLLDTATPELQRVIRFMGKRQTTSVGSAAIGSRLLDLGKRHGVDTVLRHPRHINVREFKTDNFILLGSRLSVPWVELFEPSLNFPMRIDPKTRQFYLQNRSPRSGEPLRYARSASGDETYADIAVLPNMDKSGTALILNAIDMLGVESAGEFAMSGALSSNFRGATGEGFAGGRVRSVEILLRVRSIGGTTSKWDIVAIREDRGL